jgi:hypothetical protein
LAKWVPPYWLTGRITTRFPSRFDESLGGVERALARSTLPSLAFTSRA